MPGDLLCFDFHSAAQDANIFVPVTNYYMINKALTAYDTDNNNKELCVTGYLNTPDPSFYCVAGRTFISCDN